MAEKDAAIGTVVSNEVTRATRATRADGSVEVECAEGEFDRP